MHHLVPQFILEKEAAGQSTGQFDAPALFVDVSGFSLITDVLMQHGQHGSEVLARVMRAVFTPLVESVYGYGGFITTYAGDAFTAVFPHNHPPHALIAAWQMIQHMQTHSIQSTEYGDFSFTIRIGLAAGNVQWGIVHAQDGEQAAYYFKGSAIQRCLAAEGEAESGQLIVHESIAQMLENVTAVAMTDGFYRVLEVPLPWPESLPIAQPTVDLAIATRFFPQVLFQQVQSGEFRQVLCAFVNLQGNPEHDELENAMQLCFALQKRFGGLMSRLDFSEKGCYLLLFWGAPRSYEQDMVHALGFLLEFRRHVRLPLRAGLTYRIAHAGFMGAALREEYTLYSHGINLAARFMVASGWQEIWVDEEIVTRLDALFQFDYLDERMFKGFPTPQPIYQLVRRSADEAAFYQGNMVGREREMTELQICVVDVLNGRFGGLVNIVGEAGIGKSRLIHEFLENTAVLDRCQVFLCQTDEIVRRPFNPFRYFMQIYFNQSAEQDDAKNKEQFELVLSILKEDLADIDGGTELIAELERTTSFLGALIDLYWPDSLYEELEPQLRFENSIAALKTLFKAESLIQPIIIVLEDVHWLDDASYDFIEQLTRNIDEYPIFIIATSRPVETSRPLTISSGETTTIYLEALQSETLAMIAYDLLGGEITAVFTDYLTRADGNPFFAEQIILDLQERELVVKKGTQWSLLEAQADSLPTDVRAVLLARLDRLTHEVKDVVHTASVLGREFELRHLLAMLRDDDLLEEKVTHAEQMAIWSILRELRYIFKHALLRDAAYRMQLRARRQELHKLAVEVLESLYAEDLRPYYAELAHHAEKANLPIKARDYYRAAGELAQKNYQNNLAQKYYTNALNLTQSNEENIQTDLLLAREEAYYWLGNREKQKIDLKGLEKIVDALQDREKSFEIVLRRVRYLELIGSYHDEIKAAQEGLEIANQINQPDNIARALKHLGTALYMLGDYAGAKVKFSRILKIAADSNHPQLRGDANYHLAEIATKEGDYALAEQLLNETLSIDQMLGNRQKITATQNFLGIVLGQMLNYIEAKTHLENALLIQREIGNHHGEWSTLNNLGAIAHVFGDYDRANSYYENSLVLSRRINNPQSEAVTLNNIGEIYIKRQQYEEAKVFFEESIEISHKIGFQYGKAYTYTKFGETYLLLRQFKQADVCFNKAVEIYEEINLESQLFAPYLGQIEIEYNIKDREEAVKNLQRLLDNFKLSTLDGLNDPMYYYWRCFRLLNEIQYKRAFSILQSAFNQIQNQAVHILDKDSRQSFLNNVPEHKLIIQAYKEMAPPPE